MKVKTAELSGRALDWAVAIAEGYHPDRPQDGQLKRNNRYIVVGDKSVHRPYWYLPSTDWTFCGPLIEQFKVGISEFGDSWMASIMADDEDIDLYKVLECGDTPMVAICRAVVASKLGDEVDIPDELMEVGE